MDCYRHCRFIFSALRRNGSLLNEPEHMFHHGAVIYSLFAETSYRLQGEQREGKRRSDLGSRLNVSANADLQP